MRDAFLDLPSSDTPTETLNFSKGTAAWCLEAIVANDDLMEARGRIKKNREEGKSLTEQMQELKKLSVDQIFHLGRCDIGKTCFDVIKANKDNKVMQEQEKASEARAAHLLKVTAANEVRALGFPLPELNVKQLKLLLAPLKRKEDGAMPTRKQELIDRIVAWEGRAIEVENGRQLIERLSKGEAEHNNESEDENEGFI